MVSTPEITETVTTLPHTLCSSWFPLSTDVRCCSTFSAGTIMLCGMYCVGASSAIKPVAVCATLMHIKA